jgi:hypothetical protein
MMTLKRTGTAGVVGFVSGLTGGAAPFIAGGSAVAGGILSATAPMTLPEIDAGLLDGGLAVSGYYLAGLAIWVGIVALVGLGAVVVIEAARQTPMQL